MSALHFPVPSRPIVTSTLVSMVLRCTEAVRVRCATAIHMHITSLVDISNQFTKGSCACGVGQLLYPRGFLLAKQRDKIYLGCCNKCASMKHPMTMQNSIIACKRILSDTAGAWDTTWASSSWASRVPSCTQTSGAWLPRIQRNYLHAVKERGIATASPSTCKHETVKRDTLRAMVLPVRGD